VERRAAVTARAAEAADAAGVRQWGRPPRWQGLRMARCRRRPVRPGGGCGGQEAETARGAGGRNRTGRRGPYKQRARAAARSWRTAAGCHVVHLCITFGPFPAGQGKYSVFLHQIWRFLRLARECSACLQYIWRSCSQPGRTWGNLAPRCEMPASDTRAWCISAPSCPISAFGA